MAYGSARARWTLRARQNCRVLRTPYRVKYEKTTLSNLHIYTTWMQRTTEIKIMFISTISPAIFNVQ